MLSYKIIRGDNKIELNNEITMEYREREVEVLYGSTCAVDTPE